MGHLLHAESSQYAGHWADDKVDSSSTEWTPELINNDLLAHYTHMLYLSHDDGNQVEINANLIGSIKEIPIWWLMELKIVMNEAAIYAARN